MSVNNECSKLNVVKDIAELWSPMTEGQKKLLLQNINIKHFNKDEIIYKDLESPDKMLCLIAGKVKIFKDGIGGRNQILRVVKPIEFFGYRAFFAEEDYKTVGMAFEMSTVAVFPMEVAVRLMKENYNICFFFIRHLSKELGASDDRTVNLTQKHIRGRLAEALLFLKDSYGVEEDGYTLSIYLSREDLANISNMTTSNAIRTLSAFVNEKLIAIDGRKIKIIQEDTMRRISRLG